MKPHVCTMCGRTALGPDMSAPGPMTFWPQMGEWICGDRDCRRHAEWLVSSKDFVPVSADVSRVIA
jgi:hypothetical protein